MNLDTLKLTLAIIVGIYALGCTATIIGLCYAAKDPNETETAE